MSQSATTGAQKPFYLLQIEMNGEPAGLTSRSVTRRTAIPLLLLRIETNARLLTQRLNLQQVTAQTARLGGKNSLSNVADIRAEPALACRWRVLRGCSPHCRCAGGVQTVG